MSSILPHSFVIHSSPNAREEHPYADRFPGDSKQDRIKFITTGTTIQQTQEYITHIFLAGDIVDHRAALDRWSMLQRGYTVVGAGRLNQTGAYWGSSSFTDPKKQSVYPDTPHDSQIGAILLADIYAATKHALGINTSDSPEGYSFDKI